MKDTFVGFKCEEWIDLSIKRIAREEEVSKSEVIRRALVLYIKGVRYEQGRDGQGDHRATA